MEYRPKTSKNWSQEVLASARSLVSPAHWRVNLMAGSRTSFHESDMRGNVAKCGRVGKFESGGVTPARGDARPPLKALWRALGSGGGLEYGRV